MDRAILEAVFRMKGWAMPQPDLDDLFRGGTIVTIEAWDGDYVEVYFELVHTPNPPDPGWRIVNWCGHLLMRLSSGEYGGTLKNGHWAWSRNAHQAIGRVFEDEMGLA